MEMQYQGTEKGLLGANSLSDRLKVAPTHDDRAVKRNEGTSIASTHMSDHAVTKNDRKEKGEGEKREERG